MKLVPTIKPIGRFIVLSIIKSTLLLFELFCIPIIKKINKDELNKIVNIIFLIWVDIFQNIFKFILNYK